MKTSVVIPAHNESDTIVQCIESVLVNEPFSIYVLLDNCTDDTEEKVKRYFPHEVQVVHSKNNKDKKAGALNQFFSKYLVTYNDDDCILVLDADTYLSNDFLKKALGYIRDGYDAVGGVFLGREDGSFVGWCEANEFARYQYDVAKLKGKAIVLTGTSTLFTVATLKAVEKEEGTFYSTKMLTEDAYMSILLKHMGYKIIAPVECATTTEVMGTWSKLYRQRLRWRRGFFECLQSFGITKITIEYWLRTLLAMLGIVVTFIYLLFVAIAVVFGGLNLSAFWIIITLIFVLERVLTVRRRGWLTTLLASVIVIELVYEVFLQYTYGVAYWKATFSKQKGNW